MNTPAPPLAKTPAELRKFGFQIGGIFLAVCLLFTWRKGWTHPVALVAGALGVYLVAFAAIRPSLLAGFNRYWWKLSGFLAKYVGHYVGMVFFTLIYWVLFTPVALIMRIVGFDPLGVRRHRKASTYWHERPHPLSSDHYERQFSVEKRDHE